VAVAGVFSAMIEFQLHNSELLEEIMVATCAQRLLTLAGITYDRTPSGLSTESVLPAGSRVARGGRPQAAQHAYRWAC